MEIENETLVKSKVKMSLKINFINKDGLLPLWATAGPTFAMDEVHHPDDRSWISKPIKLSDHFESFSKKVNESRGQALLAPDFKNVSKQKIRDLMELGEENAIPNSVFNEVATNCDLDNFRWAFLI